MTELKVGEFVWAKMTGYPYWPGKVVEPDENVKKPSKKVEMFFIQFYGTGDYAWTKADLIHKYEENKNKYAQGSKRAGFLDAVKSIERAVARKKQGKPEESEGDGEGESEDSDDDDEPLATKTKNGQSSPVDSLIPPPPKKRKKLVKKSLPSREEINTSRDSISLPKNPRLSPDTTADADSTTNIVTKDIIPTDKKEKYTELKSVDELIQMVTTSLVPHDDVPCSLCSPMCEKLQIDVLGAIYLSTRIGFLGLGIMGAPMALSLIRSGHDVTVWNRSQARCKALVEAGAKQGLTPADVMQQCDIIFSCVSDADAVRDVVVGNSGVLQTIGAGKGYIEMSTVDAETIVEISEAVTMRGGRFLEAPMSGSKKSAELGKLVILAAGDRSLYMDAYSCFETFGKKTFFLGELGSAGNTKLIVNMLMGSFMASLAEGFSLAEKAGLDQYMVLEVLNLSDIACPMVDTKGSAILEGHFPANFPLKHQQKDLRLALQMGETLEQPLHVAGAANELFKRTKAIGFGDRDMSCVYRAVNP